MRAATVASIALIAGVGGYGIARWQAPSVETAVVPTNCVVATAGPRLDEQSLRTMIRTTIRDELAHAAHPEAPAAEPTPPTAPPAIAEPSVPAARSPRN